MEDLMLKVGRLQGHMDQVLSKLDVLEVKVDRNNDKIEVKLDRLNEFKWRVAGGAAALAIVLTVLVQMFQLVMK